MVKKQPSAGYIYQKFAPKKFKNFKNIYIYIVIIEKNGRQASCLVTYL